MLTSPASRPEVSPWIEDGRDTIVGQDRSSRLSAQALVVLGIGLAMTLLLIAVARSDAGRNEDRLIKQQVREASAVLNAAIPSIESPLAAAAEIAEIHGADHDTFRRLMSPIVEEDGPYVSASLWRISSQNRRPLIVVGEDPKLSLHDPALISEAMNRSATTEGMGVMALLEGDDPRLGYFVSSSTPPFEYMAYAEAALPTDRPTAASPPDSAFAGLDHAIYLGETEDPAALLTASTADLPLTGRRATELIDFGDTSLLLVMTSTGALGGELLAALPVIVGVAGLATTAGATIAADRLMRRRRNAELLAERNRELYASQLSVARVLQESLLPRHLPTIPRLELAARYVPGVSHLEIGGDWYDVIELGENQVMIVVGDVSGRGLEAGTTMASLRFAIRAFASRADGPAEILSALTRLLDVRQHGHFATVLCVTIDTDSGSITIASAGHPPPLLLDGTDATYLPMVVGPPIGVIRDASYATTKHLIPNGSTVMGFTDGLFERRAETVDVGLERLRLAACHGHGRLDEAIDGLLNEQLTAHSNDDTAVLAVRWRNTQTPSRTPRPSADGPR